MKSLHRAGTVLLSIGAALFFTATWRTVETKLFIARATSAPGLVTKLFPAMGGDDDSGPLFTPRVQFKTPDGKELSFDTDVGLFSSPTAPIGTRIAVLYAPGEEPRIHSFRTLWAATALCGMIGAIFAGLGAVMRTVYRVGL